MARPLGIHKTGRARGTIFYDVAVLAWLLTLAVSSSFASHATSRGRLSVTESSLSFGGVAVGSTIELSVKLSNSGRSDITVSKVSISGPGFSVNGLSTGQTLAPETMITLNVAFAPAATGSETGTVTISSDAQNSPTKISLSGTASNSLAVSLFWSPSESSSVAGYDVYRATTSGKEAGTSPINGKAVVTNENYTDTTVVAGATYYYSVTAVTASSAQSADSGEASVKVP